MFSLTAIFSLFFSHFCILNQVEKNIQKVAEEGEIGTVEEHRELDQTGTRKGDVVVKVKKIFFLNVFLVYTSTSVIVKNCPDKITFTV